MWPVVDDLAFQADWDQCEQIARQHGRTFYFASRCLPKAQRRAILAAYAYCRIADDIVDTAGERGMDQAMVDLAEWEAQIANPTHPVAVAFALVRDEYDIPVQPVHDLIRGIRMDLTITSYATWDDLREYCYYVAGTVGLIVAPILGCRNPEALGDAATLGIAMQLTNILRDVGEDADLGRLYLPLEDIEAFGCTPEGILAGRPGKGFSRLMAFEISRARALYAEAHRGFSSLDASGRFTALMASDLYSRILIAIEENNYDVFGQRAHCSTTRKLLALPVISARFMRLSIPVQIAGFLPG